MFAFILVRKALRAVTSVEQVLQALNTAQEMTLAIKDEPYPYAVTVNYAPVVRDDELYLLFHGAKAGRKFTLLKRDPNCAFTITLRTNTLIYPDCRSTNHFASICGEGEVLFVEGEEALDVLADMMAFYKAPIEREALKEKMRPKLAATQAFALKVSALAMKVNGEALATDDGHMHPATAELTPKE
ncbi:MAG: pyridoxamine 5'-phosphate oxidase family protein [Candidatus Anaerobiospirillum pullicola]|uniref:Pyridoxamine 5'-phosphate oxidase family protein n=1 Tax=Candidatus Anaerobiospirillum pullicola TaxID=2838451 RepID=A0A948TEA5_9GAMM|nr:pyridoxamine 5'-phosphate oxidase family protein [Candidatus Anaerobiospirillum pullicola]